MGRLSSSGRRSPASRQTPGAALRADETTESHVRQLIRRAREDSGEGAPSSRIDPEGVVLLDVEIDGIRCLLIQAPRRDWIHAALSPREQEIARMVAKGYPNKTIARVLDISTWTVGTHLRRIFAKLGVGSRAAMVARLLEEELTWSRDDPE